MIKCPDCVELDGFNIWSFTTQSHMYYNRSEKEENEKEENEKGENENENES